MNNASFVGPFLAPVSPFRRSWWHLRDHVVPHSRNHYQPHILHHRSLAAFSVLLLAIKIFSLSALEFSPTVSVSASAITQASVLELTNQARSGNSMAALTYSATLERAAQAKADDMAARQYFAHNTPDGKTPWTFFEAVGYKYISAGENLAVHFTDVEPLQDAWMNSPGHRANILNSSFKEMGVGISRGQFEGHESIFVVEEFGNPQIETHPAQTVSAPQAKAQPITQEVKPAPKLIKPQFAAAAPEVPAQIVTEPSAEPVPPPVPYEQLAIQKTSVTTDGDKLQVQAVTTANAVKVLLTYGRSAQFFRLHADGSWSAQLPIQTAQAAETMSVKAYNLAGAEVTAQLATIAPTFNDRYTASGSVEGASVTFFGQKLPVKPLEQRAYLAIIALLLTVLVIAVAVHRHLQHVRLVANTAFVVMFATLLLLF